MTLDSQPRPKTAQDDPAQWTPAKRKRYGWLITIALLVLMMISWADKAILGIVAVPLMRDLEITPQQFGLLGSAVFMLFGVAQFVAAPIANKVKSKWAGLPALLRRGLRCRSPASSARCARPACLRLSLCRPACLVR